jgi:hypothetical protein
LLSLPTPGIIPSSVVFNFQNPAEFAVVDGAGNFSPFIHLRSNLEEDDKIESLSPTPLKHDNSAFVFSSDFLHTYRFEGSTVSFARTEVFPGRTTAEKSLLRAAKNPQDALNRLEVRKTANFYRSEGEICNVLGLEEFQTEENVHLLRGKVWKFLGNYEKAQAEFLAGSRSDLALKLAEDFLQFEDAVIFARTVDPLRFPEISRLLTIKAASLSESPATRQSTSSLARFKSNPTCEIDQAAASLAASSSFPSEISF